MTTRIDLQPNFTTSNTTTNNDPRADNSSLETTQLQVLQTIQNLNSSVGGILIGDTVVDSKDVITHGKLDTLSSQSTTTNTKLDTLNTTVADKHLDSTTDSVTVNVISGFATEAKQDEVSAKVDEVTQAIVDKHLDSTTDSITVNVISGFALDTSVVSTNAKLDTLIAKHLEKTTDSVDITNQNINVNQTVEGSSYDLLAQGSTLWGDSLPTPNPFIADLLGREGWWYTNQANVLNKSNVYWYANPPTGAPGGFQENNMTFSQLSSFYCVLTCDFVDNSSLTIPIFSVYSQPTGTNDIIPTFAHSRWAYQLSGVDLAKFRKGETVLLYSGSTRPDVFNELPSYQLQLASATGEALPSEIIGYMSVNTQGTTSIIAYLLQYVGYLNSAVGHIKQYGFKNSKERLAQENLASLTVVDGVLSVSSSGGGGGGGGVVQGISTTSGVAVDINASPSGVGINRLLVSSFIDDGTNNLSINNDGSITAISLVTAKDADSAEDNMDIFARANRLFTDTQITNGGNTLGVNSDNSIDTHCFGSSDGTTFHHLKTTANGNLITESKTHDGSNNPITSTEVSTKRGLDVNIISGGGGGGGGGVVQLQAYDSTDGTTPMNVETTANRLLVDCNVVDASTPDRKLVINSDGSINVVGTTGGAVIRGSVNNIRSGSLTAGASSTGLEINNEYGNESVISYEDTSTTVSAFISIHGSFDNITYFYIGVLQPVLVKTTLRQASAVLKLKGLKFIRITNEHTATVSGIRCTLFSGE
jgi:outer membrane murein-binding lipoprotein Lpp